MAQERKAFVHRLYDILGPTKFIRGLIILNGPPLDEDLLERVWPSAQANPTYPIVCADGGANRLYETNSKRIPTAVVGDLDSVTPNVLAHYERHGVKVCKDEDQDHNDFEKSLRQLYELMGDSDGDDNSDSYVAIVAIGGFGGRFDQTLGNLNTMYKQAEQGCAMWWIDPWNAALVLPVGANRIDVDATMEGPTVGLVPLGKAVTSVSTEGLKWNLHEQELAYGSGGLISTSNHILQSSVYITISHPLVWTVMLKFKQ